MNKYVKLINIEVIEELHFNCSITLICAKTRNVYDIDCTSRRSIIWAECWNTTKKTGL